MSALFPAPVHAYAASTREETSQQASFEPPLSADSNDTQQSVIPPYPHRVSKRFIPRKLADYGDGGAFPEIHMTQFPLNMGRKGEASSGPGNTTLALQVAGDDGHVRYDAIVTQHHRDKTKVFTSYQDLVEKSSTTAPALPSEEEAKETAERTRAALQLQIQDKVASSHPVNVTRQKSAKETSTYVRYTPHDQGKMGGQSQQRIIRMVEVPKDPMEPPKFQHKKAVRGPPSPPVPVLHSPPRKLTVQDQQAWQIPPAMSNWKNPKGFTIALDKRLAADGRGLQQVTVNDKFASFAEALAIAEREAREAVNMRAQVQKKLAVKQKEQKENELREMAAKARMERAGIRADDAEHREDRRSRSRSRSRSGSEDEEDRDDDGWRDRDRIRQERKREREREMRLEKLGRKGKLARDEDRDVSEKIALGQLQGTGKLAGDAMFDSRLFNQSQGISSGFGADDEYSVYSKPMVDRGKASVYRPKTDEHAGGDPDHDYEELKSGSAKRFKADKQFRGTEEVGHGRDGPVQFAYDAEKDKSKSNEDSAPPRDSARAKSPSRSPSQSKPSPKAKISSRSASKSPRRSAKRSPRRSPPRDRGKSNQSRRSSRSRSASSSRSRSPPRNQRPRSRSRSRSRSYSRSPSRSRSRSYSRSRSPPGSRRPNRRSPSRSRDRTRRRAPRSRSDSRDRSMDRDRKRRKTDDRDASDSDSDDPYGLDQFLSDARKHSSKDSRGRR